MPIIETLFLTQALAAFDAEMAELEDDLHDGAYRNSVMQFERDLAGLVLA